MLGQAITIGPRESFLNATLRPYQIDGVNWMLSYWAKRRNVMLADEMGLGKTAQIVATLSQLTSATERRRCTPPSGNLALGTDAGTNAPTPAGAAAKAVAASKVAHDVAGSSFHTLQGGGHALQGARLHSLSMRGRMPGRNGP